VLYNNAGVLGEYTVSGTGSVAMTTSPTFTTPILGAATATSLALGGATLGSNVLAVNGRTELFSNSAFAFAVGPNGSTNPTFAVNASAASATTGLVVVGQATGSALNIGVTSPGANESLTIDAKGTGAVVIGSASSGGVALAGNGGGVSVTGPLRTAGTGGSISATTSDANFGAGGNRAVMDIAAGNARIGSVNGGGAATTTTILVNGGAAITFGVSGLPTSGLSVSTVGGFPVTVASGTVALGTAAINPGTCGAAATATATGAVATDVVDVGFNGDPTVVTGYTPGGMLSLVPYPTANAVNVKQCNLTANPITPSALTLNFRVRR
jgi:hypothetical protein